MAKITRHSGPSYTQDELLDQSANYPRTVQVVPSQKPEDEGSDGVSVGNSSEASRESMQTENYRQNPPLPPHVPMMASHSKQTPMVGSDAPLTDGDIQTAPVQPSGNKRTRKR